MERASAQCCCIGYKQIDRYVSRHYFTDNIRRS